MGRRKTYTKEFKVEAVRLAESNGFLQTSRDLGVHETLLHRWRNQLEMQGEAAFPGRGRQVDEDETGRLRRENARLKEEVAILKKAVGIFTNRPE